MGTVYRAWDTVLGREVALKVLREPTPSLVRGVLREAQLQARIDHDHVVRVYEVGEVDGRGYIAMQYVAGAPLHAVAAHLSLEEKVEVLRQVAEAIQAAHDQGVIHRDLKPSNILVAREGTGLKAYVVDFGIARSLEGTTTTHAIKGTPHYMSPEQARGDPIDPRTDVYSLGAVLYELLTGRPPFQGQTLTEILLKVLHEDPVPVRRHAPQVSRDLEAVVMKCLEKEPHRRYPDAATMADELRRVQAGEPVRARRLTPVQRWVRAAWRRRRVVLPIGILSLLVLGGIIFAAWTRWRSLQEMRWAAELLQHVQYWEERLQYAYRQPPHDLRPDLEEVRRRLNDLARRYPHPSGPLDYALGRGFLLLQEDHRARQYLERAWFKARYRTAPTAFALGLTYARLYRAEVRRQMQGTLTPEELERLRRTYQAPALELIRWGRSSAQTEPVAYVEALLQYLEGDWTSALRSIEQVLREAPWYDEAYYLQGDIYAALGLRVRDAGQNEEALTWFRQAQAAYGVPLRRAPSDPRGYEGICQVEAAIVRLHLYQSGQNPQSAYQAAVRACEQAWQVYPGRVGPLNGLIYVHWRWAQYQIDHGQDPQSALRQALAWGQIAQEQDLADADTYNHVANVYLTQSDFRRQTGQDPIPDLEQAAAFFRQALRVDPAHVRAHVGLVNTYKKWASLRMARGESAEPLFQEAEAVARRLVNLHPDLSWVQKDTGDLYRIWGEALLIQDRDGGSYLRHAVEHYRRAIRLNERYAKAYVNIAHAYGLLAWAHRHTPDAASAYLSEAETAVRQALTINEAAAPAWMTLGRIEALRGVLTDAPPERLRSALDRACQALRQAYAHNPRAPDLDPLLQLCRDGRTLAAPCRKDDVSCLRTYLGRAWALPTPAPWVGW